jgi:hypothetical protein
MEYFCASGFEFGHADGPHLFRAKISAVFAAAIGKPTPSSKRRKTATKVWGHKILSPPPN